MSAPGASVTVYTTPSGATVLQFPQGGAFGEEHCNLVCATMRRDTDRVACASFPVMHYGGPRIEVRPAWPDSDVLAAFRDACLERAREVDGLLASLAAQTG